MSHFNGNRDDLEIFSTVRRISGDLLIEYTNEHIENLSFFRNLEVIGNELMIYRTKLVSLGLTSLKRIEKGEIRILFNDQLCYINNSTWQNLINNTSYQFIHIKNNTNDENCRVKCDEQCLCGCWGPSPT